MNLTLSILLFLISSSTFAWDLGSVGKFQFNKITEKLYVMHGPLQEPNKANTGFMNNPAIIISDNGIIVIDPGSTYPVGKKVLIEIEKISTKPILAVFNTHIHGDHWLANQAIKEKYPKVKIYANPKMIEQANGEEALDWIDIMLNSTQGLSAGTKITPPTIPLTNLEKITIDGQQFIAHSVEKAHTDTDLMIEHKNSNSIFLGDNGFSHRLGRFDESSDISGNIKALQLAQTLGGSFYIPGHGQTGTFDISVKPYLEYLQKLKKEVKVSYDNDIEDFEIKEKIMSEFSNYSKWHGFDKNFGKHINKLYLETEATEF